MNCKAKLGMMYHAGRIINFMQGEYSDRHTISFAKVLKDFDIVQAEKDFLEECKKSIKDIDYYEPDGYQFVGYLNRLGYIEDLTYGHVHTGSYGNFNVSI